MPEPNVMIDHFIEMDRQSIRFQMTIGVLMLLIGSSILVVAYAGAFSGGNVNMDIITKAAGVLINIFGLFPFNSSWSRWERIKTLEIIRDTPEALDPNSTKDLIIKLYAKFLGV